MNPVEIKKKKIIEKFKLISDKYHKMSLLFYELSRSLEIEAEKYNSLKDFKDYIKKLNLDIDKLIKISKMDIDLSLENLKGGIKDVK